MFPPDVGVDKTKGEMNVLEIIVSECFLNNKISHLLAFPLLKKNLLLYQEVLALGLRIHFKKKNASNFLLEKGKKKI